MGLVDWICVHRIGQTHCDSLFPRNDICKIEYMLKLRVHAAFGREKRK